jgi:hypothetical protein
MSSESACQVSRSWVDVSSFHTHLFGAVYVTCGDFNNGSEKEQRVCPAVSGEIQNGCHPPPTVLPSFGTLWFLPIYKNEIEAERTPVWYRLEEPGRNEDCAWQSDRKGLPGSAPKMEVTVEPVYTCGRELLRGWWQPIGLMVSSLLLQRQ